MRWQKSGSFGFAKGRLCVSGQNQMCHLCGWLKLFLKKCGGGKNKKHRVGNECRLTRCPFVKSFLCLWSPVKMVYFFLVFSPLFDVCTVVLPLAITLKYTQVYHFTKLFLIPVYQLLPSFLHCLFREYSKCAT